MKNYDLKAEQERHPYKYYGKVREEKHGNGTFLLKTALKYVIDDYDEAIGSVEQSHYESCGYYEVTNFDFEEAPEVLDLTWMDKEDTMCLDDSEQYRSLRAIELKIDCIAYSYLPIGSKRTEGIEVIINSAQTKMNIVGQVRSVLRFLNHNSDRIKSISFIGFNSIVQKLLEAYAEKMGIAITGKQVVKK